MSHSEHIVHSSKNHWETELERPSLMESPLKSKFQWLNSLTMFHTLAFRGLDKRDYYEPVEYDAWDHQTWNTPKHKRLNTRCMNYYIDVQKCQRFLKEEFPVLKSAIIKKKDYCWKPMDNYNNCMRTFIRQNMKYVNKGHVFPEDH